jgi:hypothetical protein
MSALSPAAILYDASGNPISIVNDGGVYRVSGLTKVLNAAGAQMNPATQETLAIVQDNQESVLSATNSTVAQLAGDIAFTGTSVDCLGYAVVSVTVHTDQDSAVGGMQFQFSMDGTNWDDSHDYRMSAEVTHTARFKFAVTARYFRVVYTNGDTTTTELRIQTILHRQDVHIEEAKSGCLSEPGHGGTLVASETEEGIIKWLQSNPDGRVKMLVGEDPNEPVHVALTSGSKSYFQTNLIASDEPAAVDAGVDEPYTVGNTTLTIDVNTIEQTADFPTRVAQPGIHYSAPYPATANPAHEKLKVSVDGGALREIRTGKLLTTGAAIAAALQTEIRADVENGTSVTVEYNTVEYPYRYIFKSGTTGVASSIHVEKAADDLAKIIFVGAFGGTERIGLAADSYWTDEIITILDAELSDVSSFEGDTGVHIETVAGGTSATLQVTAGGANTALQFPTTLVTGVTGSGSDDLSIDGSSGNIRFSVTLPTEDAFIIDKVIFFIRDNGAALNKFGGMAALTTGVKFELQNEYLPLIEVVNVTTNADLMTQADEGEIVDNGFPTGGQDLVKAVFSFGAGIRLTDDGRANIYVTVRDDLTDIDSIHVRVAGWVETVS